MSSQSPTGPLSPLRSALLVLAFALAWGNAVADADGDTDLAGAVAPVPASVTRSTAALPTYASYSVTLTHYPNYEVLAPVYFSATTAVLDASNVAVAGQVATFLPSSLPAGCSVDSTSTILNCTFTSGLAVAGSALVFSVTVKAPSAGDHVAFTPQASYVEDSGRAQSIAIAPVTTALTAPDPLVLSTWVPATGGTIYTGTNNGLPAPTPSNTWAALVNVPPIAGGTTASIVNLIADPGCPRAANLLDCSTSKITIPGTFSNLVITLRRDASTITKKADIGSAIVYYDQPAHADPRINYAGFAFHVPACTDTTWGVLPQSGIPCISSRNAVYAEGKDKDRDRDRDRDKKDKDKKDKDRDRDDDKYKNLLYWEFVILAIDNGRFTN